MSLKTRNKRKATFNLSSLTDIIFLLLIFFMLTSTMVSPNAIKLLLPQATGQTLSKQTVRVSVTDDLNYYIAGEQVAFSQIQPKLREATSNIENPTVVLRVDKHVPVEKLVELLDIGNRMQLKMILQTKPAE